ncbi:MAG: mechanosensitive ion channel [Candidatus Krumholzibacteria bacterium]|jgi:hypothetical protein|nr:mechanosensitive ion channel [Candidatus Krumholzibacteria bacterium]
MANLLDPWTWLLPGRLLGLFGLVVAVAVAWAVAALLRDLVLALLMRASVRFRAGDVLEVGDRRGTVAELGWRAVTLRTESRETVFVPYRVLAQQPYSLTSADASDGSAAAAAASAVAAEPAESETGAIPPDADLPALHRAHGRTLAAIAALAEPTAALDPQQVKERQAQLIRRLATIETLIAQRQAAGEADGERG